tara:strand:- start:1108 stop:2310 length:1203 start_codon:yes stop_codon:yes gene_type:complete
MKNFLGENKMKLNVGLLKKMIKEELELDRAPILEEPEQLDEKSILKNKYPFKAMFIFGPAGAGKSFLSKQIGIPKDFVVSNPDERIESVFPAFGLSMKFEPFEKGSEKDADPLAKAQQTAREVLQNAEQGHTANMLAIANPIVFDTTGENVKKMTSRIKALGKAGYDVAVFMVNVPTDVSVSRDQKRKRTVGAPTKSISSQYQREVVKERKYFELLSSMPYATILGGDIYANLFNLGTGEKLDGITDEHVAAMKTADGKPFTAEYAQSVLDKARSDLKAWLTPEPENPTGKVILRGMRALVKETGGKLGQNMLQIGPAVQSGAAKDADVIAAAEKLAELGGAEAALAGTQRSKNVAGDKFDVQEPTVRGMTSKLGTSDEKNLEEAIATRIEKILRNKMNK